MGNFKDFDLDLKVNKADGKQENRGTLVITANYTRSDVTCLSILGCTVDTCVSRNDTCNATCNCSLTDMGLCRQIFQDKNDIVPHC